MEEVFAPKVHGVQILHDLFPDGSIDRLVLFSSTSTVTAPAGQVDYVAANEYLNAYARSRAGQRTKVLAIDWGIWNEVGMAAKAMASRLGDAAPPPRHPAGSPLLDEATFDAAGHRLFTASWQTSNRWILDGHRTKAGQALLPGTGYLELAAQALRGNGETGPFTIRDLYFFRPLEVNDDQTREVRVKLARSDEGYALEVRSELPDPLARLLAASLPAGGGMGNIKRIGVLPHKPDASSIDIAHTIGADYNSTTGKVTGGHTLINGDMRVREVVSGPDVNGVYVAKVEMKTPDGRWIEKVSNNGENTMFPKDWDTQRVRVEIEHAWNSRIPHSDKTAGKWEGTSISGVKTRTPWMTPHRFTPSTHSQSRGPASQIRPP